MITQLNLILRRFIAEAICYKYALVFGRAASYLSIPSIISDAPNTLSAAIYLQNFKALNNEYYNFLICGELFNIIIHNTQGYNMFLNSLNGNVRKYCYSLVKIRIILKSFYKLVTTRLWQAHYVSPIMSVIKKLMVFSLGGLNQFANRTNIKE